MCYVLFIRMDIFLFTAGLLERPVIIESGKRREKKKVERLSMQETVPKETKKFEVGDGAGDKFGECARSKPKQQIL